jgi:hypothetical protein
MSNLITELDLERLITLLPDIRAAVAAAGEGEVRQGVLIDASLVAGVWHRESGFGHAPGFVPEGDPCGTGDHGHGHGFGQIDDRGPYRGLIPLAGQPWPIEQQAASTIRVLQDARAELQAYREHARFERAVVAAYNAGSPAVVRCLRAGVDPDLCTASGPSRRPDYGFDVLVRAEILRIRIAGLEPLPIAPVPTPPVL